MPIAEFYPERRILIDWCFAISYDLPSDLSSFYSIPIWPGFANYQTKRELPRTDNNELSLYAKYGYNALTQTHPKDFSAGELYASIEDAFTSYGFHETCLLRSVCELAKHPFDDMHQHILIDILTFILRWVWASQLYLLDTSLYIDIISFLCSPTQHDGFLESEHVYKLAYEQAELYGFLGNDCGHLYAHCKHDILRLISKVMFHND